MALTQKIATSYKHIQASASSTWTIAHNLGMYPAIDVFVDEGAQQQKIIPASISYTNANECVVTFSSNRTGLALVS